MFKLAVFSLKSSCAPSDLLFISSLYIFAILALAKYLRETLESKVEKKDLKNHLTVAVTLFEICAIERELSVVGDRFGLSLTFFMLFVIYLWSNLTWNIEGTIRTHRTLEPLFLDRTSVQVVNVGSAVAAQLAGAFLGKSFTRIFWNMGFTKEHTNKLASPSEFALRVPPFSGMVIEGLGACLFRLIEKGTCYMDAAPRAILKSLAEIYVIIAGVDYTGSQYNAAKATAVLLNSKGFKASDFFLVYWIGPLIGSILINRFYDEIVRKY